MTNKPMLSVERELLERAASAIEKHHGSLQWVIASDLRALLDKPVLESQYEGMTQDQAQAVSDGVDEILNGKPAAQHQVDPVMPGSEEFSHMSTIELRGYHAGWCAACIQNRSAEKPAPVAPFKPDTVVCRRYTLEGQNFYHYDLEPVYGSVPVTVSELINEAPIAVVMPERMKESRAYGHDLGGNYDEGKADGYNAALDEVARLNGVRP